MSGNTIYTLDLIKNKHALLLICHVRIPPLKLPQLKNAATTEWDIDSPL